MVNNSIDMKKTNHISLNQHAQLDFVQRVSTETMVYVQTCCYTWHIIPIKSQSVSNSFMLRVQQRHSKYKFYLYTQASSDVRLEMMVIMMADLILYDQCILNGVGSTISLGISFILEHCKSNILIKKRFAKFRIKISV